MSDIVKTIGERLRIYRQRRGYSQAQLAEKANVHPTYIGQLERGEKNATIESIKKVAAALNLPLETLFAKIRIKNSEKEVAEKCYELILTRPKKEQEQLLDLLTRITKYKDA